MNKIDSKISVLCLMGQTAAGKSQLTMQLAGKMPIEIISADSACVYRGMDIGTAKPSKKDQQKVPHHLIDICDPIETFSAGQFCEKTKKLISEIDARGKIPVIVGGTMLYFHLLQNGMADLPGKDDAIRKKIAVEAEKNGWEFLHKKLKAIDPASSKRIHANDAQRIQRALEIYDITGKTLTELFESQRKEKKKFDFISIILASKDKETLNKRIEKRFDQMLENGFLDEVKKLYDRDDLNENLPSIRMVNYQEAWLYLAGKYDEKEMREKAIIATRQLAKHQMTWLKRWKNATWLNGQDSNLIKKLMLVCPFTS